MCLLYNKELTDAMPKEGIVKRYKLVRKFPGKDGAVTPYKYHQLNLGENVSNRMTALGEDHPYLACNDAVTKGDGGETIVVKRGFHVCRTAEGAKKHFERQRCDDDERCTYRIIEVYCNVLDLIAVGHFISIKPAFDTVEEVYTKFTIRSLDDVALSEF